MGIRILVVEDEIGIADFIMRGLREEGYVVEHAADGVDGGHRLQKESWDLVILDWWLPGPDGLTLLRRFRQAGKSTPVLFLTARDAVAQRVEGLNAGADDYLCKPFAFEELLARVQALLRRPAGRTGMEWRHHDIVVDLSTNRAERAGKPLGLTAREQALLLYFLRHPGEVLSRTRLYEQVWQEQYDGLSNTLEVHIMELRRKLEAHGRGSFTPSAAVGTSSGRMRKTGSCVRHANDPGSTRILVLPCYAGGGAGRVLRRYVLPRLRPSAPAKERPSGSDAQPARLRRGRGSGRPGMGASRTSGRRGASAATVCNGS